MTQTAVDSEQVTALFDERERYRSWIATLEGKRATTPEHIYNRVHADYTARLQRAVEQLATHAVALQELETGLMDRLASLDIDEAKHRDEAAEIELRATVGELTAERQREVLERTTAALEELGQDRARITDELARLRVILEAGGIASAAPAAPAPVAVAPSVAPPSSEAAATGRPDELVGADPAASPTDDWQLAFEKTPEAHDRPAAASSGPHRPSAELRVDRSPEVGPFDDLEFLKTMTDARPSGENEAVGSGVGGGAKSSSAAGGSAGGPAGGASAASKSAGGQPAAAPEVVHTGGEAANPKESMAAEQVKTLKCQECGTLNYPTEWYCERCGAELAAL